MWSILAVLLAFAGPAFPAAPGWDSAETHGVAPDVPAAMTATVALTDRPDEMPHATLAHLRADDVLIQVFDYGPDIGYPPRTLPLRVADGVAQWNWEGGEGLRYDITGLVDGRSVEAIVYFGVTDPATATRRAADQRLAQLIF